MRNAVKIPHVSFIPVDTVLYTPGDPYLGMSSLVYGTGHIKDPVPLIREGDCLPVVGFLLVSFIK